jgi:endogenous inhibitor of DNA gyrase (YacG/DUF329 family)
VDIPLQQARLAAEVGTMKRRIETTLKWGFEKFDSKLGQVVGAQTNLPVPIQAKEKTKPRITEVSVTSSCGGTEGKIYITLDHDIGSGYWGIDPVEVALHKLFHEWYTKHTTSGRAGTGPKFFSVDFELARKENSFCQAAMWRVLTVLEDMGIQKLQIPDPEVTQRTFVWIPENRSWKGKLGIKRCGWIDFGEWLAVQYGLNENPQVAHSLLA